MSRLWKTHDFLFRARRERCTQFGLGLLIAATTANTVAVFRNVSRDSHQRFCDGRILLRQSIETRTDALEIIDFVDDRFKADGYTALREGT
jgi:hypothetical protein